MHTGGLGEVGTDPEPALFDSHRLERFEKNRLPHTPQTCQDHVFENSFLIEESGKRLFFRVTTGKVGRLMPRSGTKRIYEFSHNRSILTIV